MLVLLSVLTAAVVGLVVLLTVGTLAAVAAVVLLVLAGIVAQLSQQGPRRAIGSTLLLALLAAGSYGTILAIDVLEALNTTDGPVDPANPSELAAAEGRIEQLDDRSAFRLELTEPQLQAVIQEGLVEAADVPVRRVEVDLRAATRDLGFTAFFKAGDDIRATGSATVRAEAGGIDVDLGRLDFGRLDVPGVAAGAVESLLGAVTDLNEALAEQRASVQSVEVTDDLLIVTGTRATTDVLTSLDLLDAIREQAATAVDAVQAPPERIGPGRLAGLDEPGEPMVLALGDSLAANVGVDDPRLGFVSRFHRFVADADGVGYGLVNLGVPGETSGTMLSAGQLQAAEARLAGRQAAYVLVDIGANDLLGHLTSPDCGADLSTPGCQARISETLTAYRDNLGRILDRIAAAAGDAEVLFLQAYNPFSLGLGESEQERQSSEILSRLNAVAAEEASRRGITVADGFTPLQDTTAATTHMLDPQPDIHPNAAGYDVLAGALVDALG